MNNVRTPDGYDVLCLSETHFDGLWRNVDPSRFIPCEKRTAGDPASGVAIILSARASKIVKDSGAIGSRICWVKLGTSYGRNVWIVNVYIPHFYRQSPSSQDTYAELHAFLLKIPLSDCIYLCGDFNSRLARNIPNLTGQYCIHNRTNEQGEYLKDICQDTDLYAISTHFTPKSRKASKIMPCTGHGTYISSFKDRTPTQIDYIFVSKDFKSDVVNCYTTWEPAIKLHSSGISEDHSNCPS